MNLMRITRNKQKKFKVSKNNARIGCDIDGVLADFYLAMCRKFGKPYETIKKWDVNWINSYFHMIASDEEFWNNLPILSPPDAINFDIYCYITDSPAKMLDIRKYWLLSYKFPEAPVYLCSHTRKNELCDKLGLDYYIDDRPSTIMKMIPNKVKVNPIRFSPPYMKYQGGAIEMINEVPVITHLSEVSNIVAGIKDLPYYHIGLQN